MLEVAAIGSVPVRIGELFLNGRAPRDGAQHLRGKRVRSGGLAGLLAIVLDKIATSTGMRVTACSPPWRRPCDQRGDDMIAPVRAFAGEICLLEPAVGKSHDRHRLP